MDHQLSHIVAGKRTRLRGSTLAIALTALLSRLDRPLQPAVR